MDLEPGERLLFEGHPSWRSILGFYLGGLVLAAVAVLIAYVADDSGLAVAVGIVAVVLLVVIGLVKRIATTYAITSQRLRIRRGIVARKVQETRLERVQNVNTSQSVLERLLQVGTVDFDTAGSDDFEFAFKGVAQPEAVVKAVNTAVREAEATPG